MLSDNLDKNNNINNINNSVNGVKIFALGGLNEVGKNAYCIETNEIIVIVDMGIKFLKIHDNFIKGLVPETKYLNFTNKIKILVITHGHEDHIGGILFLLKNVGVSIIYAPKLAAELIRNKLKLFSHFKNRVKIVEYNSDSKFDIRNGEVYLSFFSVTHSIPDSFGIVIDTVEGRIVTTGDFKIDLTPINNANIELDKIACFGREKVDLLLSDSTNAALEGYTSSEKNVYQAINNIFCKTQGRIIITTFSSSIFRIQQIVSIACKYNRKIVIVGKSMKFAVEIAIKHSYMKINRSSIIDVSQINNYKLNEICIICTGSQGEKNSALSKIINGEYKIKIIPGDTVIFSSGTIPGNGEDVERIMNELSKLGANIYTNDIVQIHSSGHPSKQELMLMLRLLNPRFFMPVHGEYHMLIEHAKVANLVGIKHENIFVLNNGDTLILKNHDIFNGKNIPITPICLDDNSNVVSKNIVFEKDIIKLNGIVIIIVFIPKNIDDFRKPFVLIKGFILEEIDYFKNKVCSEIHDNIENFKHKTNDQIKKMVILLVENIMQRITKKRPLIIPVIITKNN